LGLFYFANVGYAFFIKGDLMRYLLCMAFILTATGAHADETKAAPEEYVDGTTEGAEGALGLIQKAQKQFFVKDSKNSTNNLPLGMTCPAGRIDYDSKTKQITIFSDKKSDGSYKGTVSQFLLGDATSVEKAGSSCRWENTQVYHGSSRAISATAIKKKKCDPGASSADAKPATVSIDFSLTEEPGGAMAMKFGYADDGVVKFQCTYSTGLAKKPLKK
jgi:hypothetical protein